MRSLFKTLKRSTKAVDPLPNLRITKDTEKRTVIRLNAALMHTMRWVIGDRVDLLIDDSRQEVILRRVLEKDAGWMLSGGSKDAHGKSGCATFSFTSGSGSPTLTSSVTIPSTELICSGEGILFQWPSQPPSQAYSLKQQLASQRDGAKATV